jgi:hypothetical protein
MPILCRLRVIFCFFRSANRCQFLPMHAIPGQSMPILANPCQSMPIRCQSGVILSFRKIANLGQYVPIQSKCFSQTHILQSSANSSSAFQQLSKANPYQSRSIHCLSYANTEPLCRRSANLGFFSSANSKAILYCISISPGHATST